MTPDDATLGELVVAAHVPLVGGTRGTRNGVRTTHDSYDQIACRESGSGGRLDHFAEPFVADDQLGLPVRWLAVHAIGDLAVGAAHAEQTAADQ